MLARTLCPIVVGREAELSELEDVLLGALRGEGGVAFLSGEAGMGKTRLVAEMRRRAERLGCEVMSGGCSEAELSLPYLPFVEAIGNHLGGADVEALRRNLGGAAVELGRLFPQMAVPTAAGDGGDPTQAKLRLFEAVITLLGAIARQGGGLLLVIEDIHWADPSTRELLDYMTRRLSSSNVLVLATIRSDELHRRHPLVPLLQGWRRSGTVVSVELSPLSPEGVRQMISATFDGEEVGDEFRDFMLARSEGNPFVVEEMLKAALDRGDIFRTDKGWDRKPVKELYIPASVRDAILVRVERLQPEEADVLRAATVLGQQFTYAQLAALTRVDEPRVEAAIQTGVTQQLIADAQDAPGAYRFRHALTREAVYEDILVPRRQQLHARAAELLRDGGECACDIAYHLFAAGRAQDAVPLALQAAEEASAAGAYADAAEHYERALAHVTGTEDRARLLCRLGEALVFAGELGRARHHLEAGLAAFGESGDVLELAGYRMALARTWWDDNEPERAMREFVTVRESIKDRGPTRELAIAHMRMCGSYMFDGEDELAREAGEEAVRVAEAVGADDVRVWSYNFLGCSLVGLGEVDRGLELLDRSYREAAGLRLGYIGANACYNEIWIRNQLLRTEAQDEVLSRYRALPSTTWSAFYRMYSESIVGITAGDVVTAESLARRAKAGAEATSYAKMIWRSQVVLSHALLEQDRLTEAWDEMPPMASRVEVQDINYDGLARGRLLGQRGSEEEVRAFVQSIVADGPRVVVFPGAHLAAVELLTARGEAGAAAPIVATMEAFPGSERVPFVAHARGLLELEGGNLAAAVDALERARAGYEAAKAPLEEARALIALATAYHRGPSEPGAIARALQQAADLAEPRSGHLVARLAREAAARLGVDLGEASPEAPPPLEPETTAVGERMVTVLFLDVRGYTAMTQTTTPGDMAERIGTLQRWAAHEVSRRGGLVDKFAGDAVMATFNISGTKVDHALDALRTAITIRDKAALLDLPVGGGIAVGPAVVGRLGGSGNVSVLGNTTNLASRLQGQAGAGEILLSDEAFRRCRAWLEERGLVASAEEVELKGFAEAVPAYRLKARPPAGVPA